jgi:hypothetical protein
MDTTDDSTMEHRYAAAYAAMSAFEDGPYQEDRLLSGYPLEEQFRIDLVLWTVERLRRMGRPMNAAWLMHELLFFCAYLGALDADSFIHHIVLGQLRHLMWLDLQHDERARNEFSRITDTVVDLLESVE